MAIRKYIVAKKTIKLVFLFYKKTTELVLFFHKETTKLVFLMPNMSQTSIKMLRHLFQKLKNRNAMDVILTSDTF